ncbi:hypothetical protein THAOC_20216, partial [Thalassiosira oceanica]
CLTTPCPGWSSCLELGVGIPPAYGFGRESAIRHDATPRLAALCVRRFCPLPSAPPRGRFLKPDQDQEQRKRGREKRGGEGREGGEGKREKEWCYLIHGAHSRTGVVVSASFSRRRQRLKRGSQALVMQSSLLLPSVHEAVEFTHCTAKPIDPHLAPVFFSEPRPSST